MRAEAAGDLRRRIRDGNAKEARQTVIATSEFPQVLSNVAQIQGLCCLQRVGGLAPPNFGRRAVQFTHRPRACLGAPARVGQTVWLPSSRPPRHLRLPVGATPPSGRSGSPPGNPRGPNHRT